MCVFLTCCFLISCHHGMFFLDHLSLNYLLISFCLFSMKKNLEDHMSLLSNHSLISLTHISSCCVFFLHHLSLNSKSLHCLVSMKKELLDYVCFSHTISFNTILLAINQCHFSKLSQYLAYVWAVCQPTICWFPSFLTWDLGKLFLSYRSALSFD
jgi:hypothetical protein